MEGDRQIFESHAENEFVKITKKKTIHDGNDEMLTAVHIQCGNLETTICICKVKVIILLFIINWSYKQIHF